MVLESDRIFGILRAEGMRRFEAVTEAQTTMSIDIAEQPGFERSIFQ